MGCGATIVTVLFCVGRFPGTMNRLQVIAEIQETRSTTSVFGLRLSLRRLPAGILRHASPGSDAGAGVGGETAGERGAAPRAELGAASAASDRNNATTLLRISSDQHRASGRPFLKTTESEGIAADGGPALPIWRVPWGGAVLSSKQLFRALWGLAWGITAVLA